MCGIVAAVAARNIVPVLIEGLMKLEYRGYDSAGLALLNPTLTRLRSVLRGRTAILISHRISTVREADQIVVLSGGQIVERGTHEELIERGSYYPELYQKQLLEEELERA